MREGGDKFFPAQEIYKSFLVQNDNTAWFCADLSKLTIKGNFQTHDHNSLLIEFKIKEERCVNKEYDYLECLLSSRDEKIAQSTEAMVLTNTQRFDSENYSSEGPVIDESVIKFFNLPMIRMDRTFTINETLLSYDNNLLMPVVGVTDNEVTFFSVNEESFQTRTPNRLCRLGIQFQMSIDQHVEDRSVFTFFDLLGNVGGFAGVLASIAAVINNFFNYQRGENQLVTQLYKTSSDDTDSLNTEQSPTREYILGCLPSCFISDCCIKKHKDSFFSRGREKLASELDVVSMLKKMRFYDISMKSILDESLHSELKAKSEKEEIELEHDETRIVDDSQDFDILNKITKKPIEEKTKAEDITPMIQ